MSGNSWVTLATNDSYSLGALVLARSLKRVGTIHNLTVLVTPGVSTAMRSQLASVFNVIEEVNILDSKDEKNLALLTRPDLGITFTKLHCWRLTQFSKCVFLDADILVLQNCDELFDREELSAAPDVGWPDCFNSGVFVYRPSIETYNALINFALSQGSFDGGDQGLLNQFFADWATKDINRHLPFIYNMCSSATYSYLPAFKQFGQNVKIVHFIGSSKPWLQYLESETRQVRPTPGSEHLQGLLQLWWDIFCNDVHSTLSSEMAGLAGALSQLTLGVARSPEQIALEEHLRKQAWEHGNIDYMGRDSFDNIWQKICQTLAEAPSADPLPEQRESSSQVSSVVVETISKEVASADVTPPTLPETHSVASAPKESIGIGATLSSTDTGPISKTLDVSSDSALSDAKSVSVLNNISSTSPEVLADLPSSPTPATNVSDLVSSAPVLTSSEIQDGSIDHKLVSQLKDTVSSSAVGISTDTVQPVIPKEVVIAQKDDLQLTATDRGTNISDSGKEYESQETHVSVPVSLQEVPLADDPSQELLKSPSESVVETGSDALCSSISRKDVSEASEELTKPELKTVPLAGETVTVAPVDSQLTSEKSESQDESEKQSAKLLAKVEVLPTESSARVDTVSADTKTNIDLVNQSNISSTQSIIAPTSDGSIDAQKVIVTAPTPPTSPTDSSIVLPPAPAAAAAAAAAADGLSVDPSILPTPPVVSELPSAETAPSSDHVSATSDDSQLPSAKAAPSSDHVSATPPNDSQLPSAAAPVSDTVLETPASVPLTSESPSSSESSQAVDPKAPVPPKRRHKPSDQSGNKAGKAPTKAPKGKK